MIGQYFCLGGGPLVLLVNDKGKIGLIRKFQHQSPDPKIYSKEFPKLDLGSLGRMSYELAGGMAEAGETSKEAALREVEEETGYKVNKRDLHRLGFFCSDPPTIINSDFYFWVKVDSSGGPVSIYNLDLINERSEYIQSLEFFTLKQLLKLVRDGKLYDGRTLAALFAYFGPKLKKCG